MALTKTPALQFRTFGLFGAYPKPFSFLPNQRRSFFLKPLVVEARVSARKESAKIRNRRIQKKEAAERVGEELIKTCIDLNINEISSYDRNGCSRGEKMQAFEIPISRHGFLAQ